MNCPVCNGEMYDQAKSKFPRKPGSPDFKCKDKECKYTLNRETGEYEQGEYTTGVWLPKPKVAVKVATKPVSAPNSPIVAHPVNQDHAKKEMLISYAKDIVVAEIAKGEVAEPFKRVADGFKVLMMAYTHPFGQPKPKEEEEIPEEPIENPFDTSSFQ